MEINGILTSLKEYLEKLDRGGYTYITHQNIYIDHENVGTLRNAIDNLPDGVEVFIDEYSNTDGYQGIYYTVERECKRSEDDRIIYNDNRFNSHLYKKCYQWLNNNYSRYDNWYKISKEYDGYNFAKDLRSGDTKSIEDFIKAIWKIDDKEN